MAVIFSRLRAREFVIEDDRGGGKRKDDAGIWLIVDPVRVLFEKIDGDISDFRSVPYDDESMASLLLENEYFDWTSKNREYLLRK